MDRCFPVGVRFHPTDEELVGHYLHLKNNPNSATPSLVLPEFDLYGEAEPWIIWDAYGGPNLKQQDLFFFTLLKKKANPRGGHASTRHSRRVGSSGTWSQGEPSKPVFGDKNQETPIGRKTKLRYENKLVPEQHGCWIMEEYSTVDDHSSSSASHDDYVICRLRQNNTNNRSSSSGQRGAIRNNNDHNKRKSQDDDDHHPKPRKKPKSLTVADPQPAFTTNEARKTVSLNQSPNPEQQFENELIISEAQSSISNCIGMPEDIDWLDLALEEVEGDDRLSPALSEQQTLSSSLTSQMQANPSSEETYTVPPLPHIGSEWQQPIDQNQLVISEAQVSSEDEAFSFAFDDIIIPMDHAYINSDEFSNYIFGDEFMSGGDDIGTADLLPLSSSFPQLLED